MAVPVVIEVLKLILGIGCMLVMLAVPLAYIVIGLKWMNTVYDVRNREQKIKLEAEDLQRRETVLATGWIKLHDEHEILLKEKLSRSKHEQVQP